MVREIVTLAWCDLCMSRSGNRAEVAESHRVVLDGKAYEVDLCTEHLGEFKAFADLVATASAAHRPEPTKPKPSTMRTCLLCGHVVTSSSGLGDHCLEVHGLRTIDVFGLTCPLCAQTFTNAQGLGVHCRSAHMRDHAQVVETTAAFLVAESLGDPHGVVKRARERATKASRTALAKREREAAKAAATLEGV